MNAVTIACFDCRNIGSIPLARLGSLEPACCDSCGSANIDAVEDDDFVTQASLEVEGYNPAGERVTCAKTATPDFGDGNNGGYWKMLLEWLRGPGDHSTIPSWFPKRWLTPEEIATGHWSTQGGQASPFAFGSKTAADAFPGHEGHDIDYVSMSTGEKVQCNTCKQVIAWWPEGSQEPMDYIPSGVTYTGSKTAEQAEMRCDRCGMKTKHWTVAKGWDLLCDNCLIKQNMARRPSNESLTVGSKTADLRATWNRSGLLHYKGPHNEVAIPFEEGTDLFDPTGEMTGEQFADLQAGRRVKILGNIEMWVTASKTATVDPYTGRDDGIDRGWDHSTLQRAETMTDEEAVAVDWLLRLRQLQADGMSYADALAQANLEVDLGAITASKTATEDSAYCPQDHTRFRDYNGHVPHGEETCRECKGKFRCSHGHWYKPGKTAAERWLCQACDSFPNDARRKTCAGCGAKRADTLGKGPNKIAAGGDDILADIRSSLKGRYKVPENLVAALDDEGLKKVWMRLQHEDIPPLYFDTGRTSDEAWAYRAHNLVTNYLIDQRHGSKTSAKRAPISIRAYMTSVDDVPVENPDVLNDPKPTMTSQAMRCSNCFHEWIISAIDPAQPVPICPNCSSTATTPAGANGVGAVASRAAKKVTEIVVGILSTNPYMPVTEAQRLAEATVRSYPKMVTADQPKTDYLMDRPYGTAEHMSELGRADALAGRPKDPHANHPAYDAAYEVWSEKDDYERSEQGKGPGRVTRPPRGEVNRVGARR